MNQWRKGIASWKVGKTLYQSIPFTWLLRDAEDQAKQHHGRVVAGGPAVQLMGAPWAETPVTVPFDTLAFHNPLATFTSRGCPNKCGFCAVPRLEGEFRELPTWKHSPIICDNNILACSKKHFIRVIESLKQFEYADFNQGLEARLLTPFHVDLLRELRSVKIRFAFDAPKEETIVHDAVELCRRNGLKDIGIYCLIGFDDTPETARERLEIVRSWGIRPNPMRYQPLDATQKNAYVAPKWPALELKRMTRFYSRLRWLEHIPYDDFDYLQDNGSQVEMELS